MYVNLPSSISSIFCSLCHTQCDLFDSVVREHQEKRLCMLMSLNMPSEAGKRRGMRGWQKKMYIYRYIHIYDMYITTIFFWGGAPPPPPPHPTSPKIPNISITHTLGTLNPSTLPFKACLVRAPHIHPGPTKGLPSPPLSRSQSLRNFIICPCSIL